MIKIIPKLPLFLQSHGHDEHHDDHHDEHEDHDIEVKMEDSDTQEEELGQVALDILDCREMIVILAPIA